MASRTGCGAGELFRPFLCGSGHLAVGHLLDIFHQTAIFHVVIIGGMGDGCRNAQPVGGSVEDFVHGLGISCFSFVVCNQGLNTILSISVPVLNAIYPTAIVLILLGVCDKWFKTNSYVYPLVVWPVSAVSVVYATDQMVSLGLVGELCSYLPFYSMGMGWVSVALVMLAVSLALPKLLVKAEKEEEVTSC